MAIEKGKKVAGILGGMGPEATVDLMARIVKFTDAQDDIDHVHCLVDQNPHVPSRIKYLLENGEVSPGPCLAEMARKLEKIGADFLCIPCNTAHNWYAEVCAAVDLPVLNMVSLASGNAASQLNFDKSGKKRVGILASPAVRMTGLYEAPLRDNGLVPLYADEEYEKKLLSIIRAIKSGDSGSAIQERFSEVIRHFEKKGADALIIACTELGVLKADTQLCAIDAADALAREIVIRSGAKLKA